MQLQSPAQHQLLQGSEDEKEKGLEEKVGCVSNSCLTQFETEDIEVSAASWDIAQLKARLEEEMVAHDDSSGYESNLSSLDDEENDDDILSESGVLCLTTSPCEGLVPVCESTQLVLDSSLCNEEQQEEEQQEVEVSCEEDLP